MAEEENKQFKNVMELLEAAAAGSKTGSAKDIASQTSKFASNQVELLKIFEEDFKLSQVSNVQQKALADVVRQSGIEVSTKDEERAFETTRTLTQIAFKAKMEKLKGDKEIAREAGHRQEGLLLGMKGIWLEATNKISEGFLNLQENIASSTDISTLKNAFSQDFQMLTMGFSEIMNVPGMKSMVAGIKYIAGWIAKSLAPVIHVWYKGFVADRIKAKVAKAGETHHSFFEALAPGRTEESKEKIKKLAGRKEVTGEGRGISNKDQMSLDLKKKKEPNKVLKGDESSKLTNSFLKGKSKSLKRMANSLKDFFTVKDAKGMTKMQKAFRKGQVSFKQGLRKMTNGFKKFGKNLASAAKRLAIRALGFIVNISIFLAGMVMLIAGFIMANLPIIALIALIVLLVIGLVILFKKLSENWETIKVKMAMAMDRLKLVGTKIINWFKDAGADIGYRIRQLIAKIKDGLVWIINAALEAFAKMMPDGPLGKSAAKKIRAFKMEEGAASAKVDADRSAQLAAREVRDKQLEADFEAKYAERGKELEEAAKKDAERKAKKDVGGTTDIKTSTIVNTDNREVTMAAESTSSQDSWAMLATQQRG